MLEAYIIEQMRKQEERERQDRRPVLQLPIPEPLPRKEPTQEEPTRGVIIIGGDEDEDDGYGVTIQL